MRWRVLAGLAAAAFALLAYIYLTLPDVRALATVNPPSTAFMELRERQARAEGRKLRRAHRWVRYSRISPHVKRAVLVAEDSAFWQHEGIDMEQIRQSIQDSLERGEAPRGASTITQQLAKNLYLSPSRNPMRKFQELIITRRLEAALPKARIFEIYLNVIEWGDGIWGVEAASREYFGVPAASVSREQAALLAGAIINPRALNPARPSRRLVQRQRIILARMGRVAPPVDERSRPAPTRAVESEPIPAVDLPSLGQEDAEGVEEWSAPPDELDEPAPYQPPA